MDRECLPPAASAAMSVQESPQQATLSLIVRAVALMCAGSKNGNFPDNAPPPQTNPGGGRKHGTPSATSSSPGKKRKGKKKKSEKIDVTIDHGIAETLQTLSLPEARVPPHVFEKRILDEFIPLIADLEQFSLRVLGNTFMDDLGMGTVLLLPLFIIVCLRADTDGFDTSMNVRITGWGDKFGGACRQFRLDHKQSLKQFDFDLLNEFVFFMADLLFNNPPPGDGNCPKRMHNAAFYGGAKDGKKGKARYTGATCVLDKSKAAANLKALATMALFAFYRIVPHTTFPCDKPSGDRHTTVMDNLEVMRNVPGYFVRSWGDEQHCLDGEHTTRYNQGLVHMEDFFSGPKFFFDWVSSQMAKGKFPTPKFERRHFLRPTCSGSIFPINEHGVQVDGARYERPDSTKFTTPFPDGAKNRIVFFAPLDPTPPPRSSDIAAPPPPPSSDIAAPPAADTPGGVGSANGDQLAALTAAFDSYEGTALFSHGGRFSHEGRQIAQELVEEEPLEHLIELIGEPARNTLPGEKLVGVFDQDGEPHRVFDQDGEPPHKRRRTPPVTPPVVAVYEPVVAV